MAHACSPNTEETQAGEPLEPISLIPSLDNIVRPPSQKTKQEIQDDPTKITVLIFNSSGYPWRSLLHLQEKSGSILTQIFIISCKCSFKKGNCFF
jgi:hypothetical protein